MRGLRFGALTLAMIAACDGNGVTGPSGPLPYATAFRSCGPADGPAVTIYLSSKPIANLTPDGPFVQISIWMPVEQLAGRSWSVGEGGEAMATWYAGPASSHAIVAQRGTVVVRGVSSERTIDGSVDLHFANNRVAGRFDANWVEALALCG